MMRVFAALALATIAAIGVPACQQDDRDEETLDALVDFASDPSDETWSELQLADRVQLGLGDRLLERRSAASLRDSRTWELDNRGEPFRAGVGPFSALDVLEDEGALEYGEGSYMRCASPPSRPPAEVAGLRRLSIRPRRWESCPQWFAVDVFVTEDEIAAVTLDLWEP